MKLTEDEKFMLCVMAGCETIVTGNAEGSFHRKTKNPCGVYWDGNKWIVLEAVG